MLGKGHSAAVVGNKGYKLSDHGLVPFPRVPLCKTHVELLINIILHLFPPLSLPPHPLFPNHDITDVMNQCDVLWDVQVIKIFPSKIMAEAQNNPETKLKMNVIIYFT